MPIFDQSYRAYEGRHTGRFDRLLTIALPPLWLTIKRRGFLVLLGIATVPFLVNFVHLYLLDYSEFLPSGDLLPEVTPAEFLYDYLMPGTLVAGEFEWGHLFWLFLICVYTGGGLIAADLQSGALPLYLSRPVTRTDYLLGRLLTIMLLGSLVTLIPISILWMVFAGKAIGGDLWPLLPLLVRATALSAFLLLTFGLFTLFFSSVSSSRRTAGIYFAIVYLASNAIGGLVYRMTKIPALLLCSFSELYAQSGNLIMGVEASELAPLWIQLTSLSILIGAALAAWTILMFRISAKSRP